MKYLKYYEGRSNVNFDAIIEEYNKHLNPLGILVTKRDSATLNVGIDISFKFNLNFMCIPYSILHLSTMIFSIHDSLKSAFPYVDNESFNFIKSLDYSDSYRTFIGQDRNIKYNEENIYNNYYNKMIGKLSNFNNNIFIIMNSGSNGNLNYTNSKNGIIYENTFDANISGGLQIDCKSIIIDYLNTNKTFGSEVVIPQSSIDMVKYVINKFKGNQHQLIHGIQKNNPLVYEKIKDKNSDDAADMHDMGFSD